MARDLAALDEREALGVAMTRRRGIEHDTAADGRLAAKDDPVAAGGDDGLGQPELRPAVADSRDARRDVTRSVMERESRAVLDRLQLVERDVEPVRDGVRAGRDERVAAAQLAPLDTRERDGDALAGLGPFDGVSCTCTERMRTSRPPGSTRSSSPSATDPDQSVPVTTVPMPAKREDPVDVEPRRALGARAASAVGRARERRRAARRDPPRSWR